MKTTLLMVALLISTPVIAKKYGKGEGHGGDDKIFEQLDLTEEQKTKLKEVTEGNRAAMKALHEKKKATREKMRKLFETDASEDDLRKNHQESVKIQTDLENQRFENILSVRKVLTVEQRKKFHELKKNRRGMRKERRKNKKGP